VTRISRISVVAPLRDEAAHVVAFIGDLARQDYGGEIADERLDVRRLVAQRRDHRNARNPFHSRRP